MSSWGFGRLRAYFSHRGPVMRSFDASLLLTWVSYSYCKSIVIYCHAKTYHACNIERVMLDRLNCTKFQINLSHCFTDNHPERFCDFEKLFTPVLVILIPRRYISADAPQFQIPQCIWMISHNESFCNRNVHISVTKWCIVGYGTGVWWGLWDWSSNVMFWNKIFQWF